MRYASDNEPVTYQELLRSIGQLLDVEGWHGVSLHEQEDGILIEAGHPSLPPGERTPFLLGLADLQAMVRAGRARRGAGRATALLDTAQLAESPMAAD